MHCFCLRAVMMLRHICLMRAAWLRKYILAQADFTDVRILSFHKHACCGASRFINVKISVKKASKEQSHLRGIPIGTPSTLTSSPYNFSALPHNLQLFYSSLHTQSHIWSTNRCSTLPKASLIHDDLVILQLPVPHVHASRAPPPTALEALTCSPFLP
jgi:hypothetical protein